MELLHDGVIAALAAIGLTAILWLLASALWLRGAQTTAVGLPFEGTWHYGDMRGDNGVIIKLSENTRLLHEALGLPAPAAEE